MNFYGLQKLSLLDYPGKMCATAFTRGCNFRCPFCHNASLVVGNSDMWNGIITEQDVISLLEKRQGILEGICITGGEPTLYGEELFGFMRRVKKIDILIKLDTNGSHPEFIKAAVEEGIVDYIAMDIKSSKEGYGLAAGIYGSATDAVCESAEFLMSGAVDFEFRTTVVKPLHQKSDFESIGKWLQGDEKYFIQSYKDSGDILISSDENTKNNVRTETGEDSLSDYSTDELNEFLQTVRKYIPNAELRGV